MKKLLLVLLAFLSVATAFSQEEKEGKKFEISFSGFVKNDFFLDTRQTVTAREGHFLLWPSAPSLDEMGDDINAKPNLNMLAIQSRLSGKITGPDAFGAKTSGVIEGDFFAQANDNINLLRMRHAFVKLAWENTELLTGQTWNPMFVTGCFPGTVSFNTGTPIQSFARNPQIRLTQRFGNLKVMVAMLAQRDFTSRGAAGVSSDYLRNSAIPDLHFQLQYSKNNADAGTGFFAAAGVAYKSIVPRLFSVMTISPETTGVVINMADSSATIVTTPAVTKSYKVDETVTGLSFYICNNIKLKPVTIKWQYRYGENIPDVLAISGFAVKDVINEVTGEQSYTPLVNSTVWADIHTNGKKFQAGVFAGMLMNMGTKEAMSDVTNSVYGLGTNIKTLVRVSPRIIFNSGKFRAAMELEYTAASYGDSGSYDVNYVPASTTDVSNIRVLLSTYYFF